MLEAIETINIKGYTVEIFPEDYPEDPRSWDNAGTMVCWHRRYDLGDIQPKDDPQDYFRDEIEPVAAAVLPLYLYDHSGITISTGAFSCPWDSGQVGWIFITKEKAKTDFGIKRLTKKAIKRLENYLRAEVKTYDDYLTGAVYGYAVKNPNGEEIDGCWGYFGYDHKESGLLDAANSMIDYDLTQRYKKAVQAQAIA